MVFKQLLTVFRKPQYALMAVIIALVLFTLALWLPNLQLISIVFMSDTASVYEKMRFIFSLYGAIGTNFTLVSATYTTIIAGFFGINIALLVYYIRKVRSGIRGISSTGAVGIGGLVSGMFGIGCAACGTFLLAPVLSLFGAAGLLASLPFGGEEFGFLGVVLLGYSMYRLAKQINTPMVCEIV
jgi:hypothetical protein